MGKIAADILSFEKGAEHFENLKAIRVKSKNYNLLIMEDYMPLIGEIEGNLSLVDDDGNSVDYTTVTGYYRHSHNQFEFIVKDYN